MAKKVKFPLAMGNDVKVRSIEELKENYNAEKVTEYFLNGKLITWLEDRYYSEEAEKVKALSESGSSNPAVDLGAVFGIKTEEAVDVEVLETRRKKLEKLREVTADDAILANVDITALSQEDLSDLLDEEAKVIYLYGENFRIPLNIENVKYIGINEPTVSISGSEKIDLNANGIVIKNCVFSNDTKKRIKNKDDNIPYTPKRVFSFCTQYGIRYLDSYTGHFNIVKIPGNANVICENTFKEWEGNNRIKRIILPESIEIIREGAFYNCQMLTDINIPDSVKVIGCNAFRCCKKLSNVIIPDNIVTLAQSAFAECSKDLKITYRGKVYNYDQITLLCKEINGKLARQWEVLRMLGIADQCRDEYEYDND